MKKKLSVIGMIIGLAFVVVGILSIFGVLGGETSSPSSVPYYYDSGYATFGSDYYSYSSNNAAAAASAARTTAYNIGHVSDFILTFFGLSSILFGLMVMCGFGIVLASCSKENKKNLVSTETDIAVENTDTTNTVSVE